MTTDKDAYRRAFNIMRTAGIRAAIERDRYRDAAIEYAEDQWNIDIDLAGDNQEKIESVNAVYDSSVEAVTVIARANYDRAFEVALDDYTVTVQAIYERDHPEVTHIDD